MLLFRPKNTEKFPSLFGYFDSFNFNPMKNLLLVVGCVVAFVATFAQSGYQRPPEDIAKLVEAPTTPFVAVSPDKNWMVMLNQSDYPSIEELSRPELRIAGQRINPDNFGPTRLQYTTGIKLKNLKDLKEYTIANLPSELQLTNLTFSPDNKKAVFLQTYPDKIELWLIDIATMSAKKLTDKKINSTLTNPISWLSNSNTVVFLATAIEGKTLPIKSRVPEGPVIEENLGKKAPSRTYQDLLKNPYDETLFDYYCTSQLWSVSMDGVEKPIGKPAVYNYQNTSPDGTLVLTKTIQRPYSYLVPASLFPQAVSVIDLNGSEIKRLVNIPLGDNIPIGFSSTIPGPRQHGWRSDAPATVYWVEAQDGGDPKKKTDIRDVVYELKAPFNSTPTVLAKLSLRYAGITWGNEKFAGVSERWWADRRARQTIFSPSDPSQSKVVFDGSYEDAYKDPGDLITTQNSFGKPVMLISADNSTFLKGAGSSPEGDHPFLDKLDLQTGKVTRLWKSENPFYEQVVNVIDTKKVTFVTSRESNDENPNYYLRTVGSKNLTKVTNFPHPYPQLKGVKKEVLKYKRADGVDLTANLYMPPGYKKEDGPLPAFLWAYPEEFKSKESAGQVTGSPYTFTKISSGSPLFWIVRGYAILDNTSIPIVGEGDNQPNDTYIDQLVSSAKAAIDYAASLGYIDPNRVGVGGHSYGAFMTANLLAHTKLFKAGIARSGAYNRTLTPFGFQQEERTYWEAPEVYYNMSPFSFADQIKTPILLVHGEADNNSGTFPIQTERLYNAIKGHGGTARYVLLPYESHGYRAKESIMHMLWEMDNMLETYVKGNPDMKAKIEAK